MKNIKGRHWVFIIGIIATVITSIWSPETAGNMSLLLLFMGIGIVICK